MKKRENFMIILKILVDILMIFSSLIGAYFWRMKYFEIIFLSKKISFFPPPETLYPFDDFFVFSLIFTLILTLILAFHGRYKFDNDEKFLNESLNIFWGFTSGMSLLLVYFFFAKWHFFSRLIFGLAWILGVLFLFFGRIFIRIFHKYLQKYFWEKTHILILGKNSITQEILKKISQSHSLDVFGVLISQKDKNKHFGNYKILGLFKDLEKILEKNNIDEVWLTEENTPTKIKSELINITHIHHKKFKLFPSEIDLDLAAMKVSTFKEIPIITLIASNLQGWGLLIKSLIDRVLSFFILLFLSPLFLIIFFKIKSADNGAPAFYASKRVGVRGKLFDCYKFRTMKINADKLKKNLLKKNEREGGILFKIENDPRITPLGKKLRKYSLDELPQLFNVLKGDMSLIGPRPHLPEEVEKYPKENLQLLFLKPGLTGFAQVHGRSDLSFEEEMKYEMFYLKNWSVWLDIIIFFKTILVVVRGKNK